MLKLGKRGGVCVLVALLGCALLLATLMLVAPKSASAADVPEPQSMTSGDLAGAIARYRQANPGAALHQITASHKVVYAYDAYFKDMVNATTSWFSCYAKTGSDAVVARLSQLGVSVGAMSDANAAASREILVGVVDRAAEKSFLPLVDVNEYGIMVTENAIILLAWHDAALQVCVEAFVNYLNTSTLQLPVGFCGVGVANTKWKVDFPRPVGGNISLTAAQHVNDDSLQLLYTGKGVTQAAYLSYCAELVSGGYALVWENSIGNNVFRMYQSTAKGTALYVAYNDFTYQAAYDALYQANYGSYDDGFAPEFEKCIRIVSSPLSSVTLPGAELNERQSYVKVTDSYMTTLGIESTNVGTGYVIMLEDGRFIIIDGGKCSHGTGGSDWCAEVARIWDAMLYLYKKAYGTSAAPTAQRPLHVAAWYLTHAHADHYGAMQRMLTLIGKDASRKAVFKMDYMVANMIGEHTMFQNTSTQWGYASKDASNHRALQKAIGFRYIKLHTGQRLHFANLTVEVLMTFEDHLPNPLYNTNDTNTITRFYFQGSGAGLGSNVLSPQGETASVLFLGDSWRPASRYLCAMYGNYLKSDISQVAHHGNIGCEQELYAAISPRGVLFPNDKSSFVTYAFGSTTNKNPETQHAYAVDQYVVRGAAMNGKTLNSVEYVWAAVGGTYTTLQFTATGAQYGSAFDARTGRAVAYVSVTQASSKQTGFVKTAHTHTYATSFAYDAQKHWKACSCGSKTQLAVHADTDRDGKCDVCSYVMESIHEYGAWQQHDASQHKRPCSCGEVHYAAHRWNSGTVVLEPTYTEKGLKRFICIDCTASKEEEIPMLVSHTPGAWEKHDAAQHKRLCSCGETEYADHEWDDGETTKKATHLEYGSKSYTCTVCGERKTVLLAKLNVHAYGAATEHNETEHKQACACGSVRYTAHTWDEGETTTPPTHLTFGEKTYTCTGCGETRGEALPKLGDHSFGEWTTVQQPEIGVAGKRVRSCPCGQSVSEAIPALEASGTAPGGAVDDVPRPLEGGGVLAIAGAAVLVLGGGTMLCVLIVKRKKRS